MNKSLEQYFERQIEWSRETFGPALRTKGVVDHIRKELREIEQDPHDLSEWIDVVILAMDGFWRHGGSSAGLLPALVAKQEKNMARTWPDWRSMSEDTAIEHDRSKDALASPSPAPEAEPVTCQTCQGNGEVVTDWDRYLHGQEGDNGDEAVAECELCNGTGYTTPTPAVDADAVIEAGTAVLVHNVEDLRLAAAAIRKYMPDTLPANDAGQIHFARALAEAAADSIEYALSLPPSADKGE